MVRALEHKVKGPGHVLIISVTSMIVSELKKVNAGSSWNFNRDFQQGLTDKYINDNDG